MRPRTMKLKPVARSCQFCQTKTNPVYTDVTVLEKFLTERGKILGKARTGICSKHQRMITREIKRARHATLVPFIVRA